MGKITLIIGGARSGKSTHAQQLAEQRGGKVVFLATATANDDEMSERIERHRKERPTEWLTLEIPHGIANMLTRQPLQANCVILDCLTLLVSNVMLLGLTDVDHPDESAAHKRVEEELTSLSQFIQTSPADWIIVSNEVGLGLVPPFPLGRIYRDLLGFANQQIASLSNEVYWMVAGIPVPIHPFRA